jgi:hypothetical protein
MRLSRMRFTARRLVVAFAIIAAILAATIELAGISKRRSECLRIARYYRWRESNLRGAAEVIRSCPEGPGRGDRMVTPCRLCGRAWSGLKPESATTHEEAARSLLQAADTLGFWAERHERAASAPWVPMPPATTAELAAVRALINGDGPLIRKYFDVL